MDHQPTHPETFIKSYPHFIDREDFRDLKLEYGLTSNSRFIFDHHEHDEGDSGYRESIHRFIVDDRVYIVSINFHRWSPNPDDPTRQNDFHFQQTYLIDEEPAALRIFGAIQHQNPFRTP